MQQLPYKTLIDLSLPWYTEGPVFGVDDDLFFTTLAGGRINRLDLASGECKEWALCTKPNGQWLADSGEHLVCDVGSTAISRYSSDGRFLGHALSGSCDGKAFYCPNDLVMDSRGGVYFSDSIRHDGQVCYFDGEGQERVLITGLDFPNGVALTTDESTLLIAESFTNRILRLPILDSGVSNGPAQLFADLPSHADPDGLNLPDGLKVAPDGTIWVAHYGMSAVVVLNAEGKPKGSIALDFPLVSNVAISGDLFAVTGGHGEPGPGKVIVGRILIR